MLCCANLDCRLLSLLKLHSLTYLGDRLIFDTFFLLNIMVVFIIKIQLLKLTDQSISLATFCNLGKFRFSKDMLGMIHTYF